MNIMNFILTMAITIIVISYRLFLFIRHILKGPKSSSIMSFVKYIIVMLIYYIYIIDNIIKFIQINAK